MLNADDPMVARMARHCAGRVIYFSMQTEKGQEGFDRVDGHCGRGGAAMVLQETDDGELLALRQGSRTMPLIYAHLIPATLDGRARMNIANALAAACAAWAVGAHLHDATALLANTRGADDHVRCGARPAGVRAAGIDHRVHGDGRPSQS